jgi:hypothetical protein
VRKLLIVLALGLAGCESPSLLCKDHKRLASNSSSEADKSAARGNIKQNNDIALNHYAMEQLKGNAPDLPTSDCPECVRLLDRELEQRRRDGRLR